MLHNTSIFTIQISMYILLFLVNTPIFNKISFHNQFTELQDFSSMYFKYTQLKQKMQLYLVNKL